MAAHLLLLRTAAGERYLLTCSRLTLLLPLMNAKRVVHQHTHPEHVRHLGQDEPAHLTGHLLALRRGIGWRCAHLHIHDDAPLVVVAAHAVHDGLGAQPLQAAAHISLHRGVRPRKLLHRVRVRVRVPAGRSHVHQHIGDGGLLLHDVGAQMLGDLVCAAHRHVGIDKDAQIHQGVRSHAAGADRQVAHDALAHTLERAMCGVVRLVMRLIGELAQRVEEQVAAHAHDQQRHTEARHRIQDRHAQVCAGDAQQRHRRRDGVRAVMPRVRQQHRAVVALRHALRHLIHALLGQQRRHHRTQGEQRAA
mmetsp:Transcript_28064/g.70464  ORF Transcript_28064/g.70464 Transcript_28064/m.70464 type:complete len:306 (-) Transcript_28064:763-1680(-)